MKLRHFLLLLVFFFSASIANAFSASYTDNTHEYITFDCPSGEFVIDYDNSEDSLGVQQYNCQDSVYGGQDYTGLHLFIYTGSNECIQAPPLIKTECLEQYALGSVLAYTDLGYPIWEISSIDPSINLFKVIKAPQSDEMIAAVGTATRDTGGTLWVIAAAIIAIMAIWYVFHESMDVMIPKDNGKYKKK